MTRDELRQARAEAVQRRSRDLQDDWAKALPRLLDDLDALDAEYAAARREETGAPASKPPMNAPPAPKSAPQARRARK